MRNARDDGGFGDCQLVEPFVEVGLRGRSNTVRLLPEERRVQKQLEDFFLCKLPLDPNRQDPLLEFAYVCSLARQERHPRELLRDSAAALPASTARQQDVDSGAEDALVVEARMLEKAIVLGRQHGAN